MRTRKTLAISAILLISAVIIVIYFRREASRDASRDQLSQATPKEVRGVADAEGTPSNNEPKSLDLTVAQSPTAAPFAPPASSGGGSGGGKRSVETEPFFDKKLGRSVTVIKGEVIVRFKQGLTDEEINRTLVELGVTVIEKKEELETYRLRIPPTASVSGFIDEHSKNGNLTLHEPNVVKSSPNGGPSSREQ